MISFAFFISCAIMNLVSTDSTAATHGGNVSKAVENVAGNGRLVELIKRNLQKNDDDYNDLTPKADSKDIANEISLEKTLQKNAQKEFNQLDAIKSPSTEDVVGDLILHSEEKPGDNPNAVKTNKKFKEYTRYPIDKKDDAVIFKNNIKKTKRIQSKNESKAALPTKKKSTDGTVRRFEAKGDNRSNANAKVLEAYLMKNQLEKDLNNVGDVLVTEESSSTEDTSASLHRTRDVNALDLAPARGSYIYKLRLRGRVCDRNVLQVEGPKYNSKGKPYLRAYRPNGIPFARTRPPSQVLPICCNCCKKSVLGCV